LGFFVFGAPCALNGVCLKSTDARTRDFWSNGRMRPTTTPVIVARSMSLVVDGWVHPPVFVGVNVSS
jgi:hypothetical protein